jgi:hypothetical protein
MNLLLKDCLITHLMQFNPEGMVWIPQTMIPLRGHPKNILHKVSYGICRRLPVVH